MRPACSDPGSRFDGRLTKRVERHLHAFEQAIYVLAGAIAVDVAGAREELAPDD